MRNNTEKSRNVVDRFLSDLAGPIPSEQVERATADVRERLQIEEWRPAPIAVFMPASRSKPVRVWVPLAVAAALVLAAGLLQLALLPHVTSTVVANSVRGDLTFADGEGGLFVTPTRIGTGRVVRTGVAGGAIALLDGSEVEIGPRAELSVVRVPEGLRIRLASGTLIVTAAKQRDGHHLYVETKDCLISVVGTVFAVNAEETGSQISVIEGEVHVQRGEISQTLLAGQQASTSPTLGPLAQNGGDAWAATASARMALLQQSTVPPPRPPVEPAPVAVPPAQNSTVNSIHGVVRNGASGEGIPDVTVTLCPAEGTRVFVAPTDPNSPQPPAGGPADAGPIIRNKAFFFALWDGKPCQGETIKTDPMGRFEFSNVKPADYVVTAQRDGYLALPVDGVPGGYVNWNAGRTAGNAVNTWNRAFSYTIALPQVNGQKGAYARSLFGAGNDRSSVTVDARQPVSEISLTLIGSTTLSGHVRDADGKPVPNAVVRIVSRDGQTVSTILTNALGEYKAYGLAPGDYRIGVSLPNGLPGAETWFSRSGNPAEGSAVTMKQGEDSPNIDIVLPRR